MTLSVIIPVYNRRDLLKEALDSLDSQRFKDFQVIIADDGSTDGSDETAESWLKTHRGHLLRLKHSGFPGLVRNRAVDLAEGEWIAFLDSDDLWKPEKLQRQLEEIRREPEIRLWHCREIWQRGTQIVSQKKQKHRRRGDLFEDALKKCIIGPSTVLIRRDFWNQTGGFRDDMEIAEDYELWLRMTALEPVGYLDEPLIIKRAGDWDQLSEKYGQIEIFRMRGLAALVESQWFSRHASEQIQSLAVQELIRKYDIYARGCRKRGKEQEAAHYEALSSKLIQS